MGLGNFPEIRILLIISLIFAFSILIANPVNAYYYNADFFINHTGNPALPINPSFLVRQFNDCSVSLNSFADFLNAGAFITDITYYSPNNTILGTGHKDLSGNNYCVDYGIVSTSDTLDEFFNSKSGITHTATKGINYLKSTLSCITSDEWLNISSNDSTRDVNGYIPNVYFFDNDSGYVGGSWIADNTNFGICKGTRISKFNDYLLAGGSGLHTLTFYYIFNSTNGYVNYNLDASSIASGGAFFINQDLWQIYPLHDPSSPSTLCATNTCTGEVVIDTDTIYVIMYLMQINDQTGATNINAPLVNTLDIGLYKPDWDCTDYSECVNGSQHRTCTDPLGKIPDSLEYAFCYSEPINSVYFGFEDYISDNVWFNKIGYFCVCTSETKSILYPENWTISNPRFAVSTLNNQSGLKYDFLKMTSETAYEGDKSLKMWNIPPQLRIPDFTNFVGFSGFTNTGFISPELAINNNSWIDPPNAFGFNVSYSEGNANNNVTFTNYDIEILIPTLATEFKNLTVALRGENSAPGDTITLSCVKIDINGYESPCQSISFLLTFQYRYADFTDWVLSQVALGNFDKNDLDTLKVIIVADSGTGTINLDWIPIILEIYDPLEFTLVYENVICGNQSLGIYPDIRNVIDTDENTSVFVERNITLPTPFMSTSFKVKKCVEPELKFPSLPICLNFEDFCYTHDESCNYESKGSITFYLKDSDGNFLNEIRSEVIYPNKWEIREYAIDSLEPNTQYTIGFAVEPENEIDPDYYCIYLDDVRIDIRNAPLTCVSECNDDGDEIRRYCKSYSGDVCTVCEEIEILKSPNCMESQSVINKLELCEDWCGCETFDETNDNYHTKFVGVIIEGCNETLHGTEKCCEYTEIEDSDFCIDYCVQANLEDVDDLLTSVLRAKGVDPRFDPLFSFVMIIFYIVIIVMAVLSYATKSWELGVIVGFLLLMALGTVFIELAWIVALVIIVAGLFFGKFLLQHKSGNG